MTTTYDPQNGRPTATATTAGALTRTLERTYDRLGRVTSYKDADGATATTTYDLLGRVVTTNDGRGTQSRTYDPQSGLLVSLEDSAAGRFTATYDPDGNLVTKTYPNRLTATTTYDETGAPVRLTYDKTSDCLLDQCRWFDFRVSESIHGQWLTHSSALSSQKYSYDDAGRLIGVEDTVPDKGCTTRSYTYDRNSNRTSLTARGPLAAGCSATAPATTQSNAYDTADRLIGPGYSYDQLGRMTRIPAATSGGASDLVSSYYVSDLIAGQTQAGVTTFFHRDPTRRPRVRETTSSIGMQTEIVHYADDSDAPSWTSEQQLGLQVGTTRNIGGIDGDLAAVEDSELGTRLQIANLHGDIIAEASLDPAIAKPLDIFETDEFGVPREPAGPAAGAGSDTRRTLLPGRHRRYSWLGAKQRATELESGVVQMGVRSYVPTVGRFTAVDPVVGGSANAYDYANADPVNQVDLDGRQAGCFVNADMHLVRIRSGRSRGRVGVQLHFYVRCNIGFNLTATIRRRRFGPDEQIASFQRNYPEGGVASGKMVMPCTPGQTYNGDVRAIFGGSHRNHLAHARSKIKCRRLPRGMR